MAGWNAFGYSLAVGRFDCHAPNLAFGMPNADPDYGHFTNAGGVIVQHRSLTDRLILGYEEEHRHARFGEQLAAGDFDGNGCTDLVVGMPYANPVGNHRHAGSATHRAGVVRIHFV